MSAPTPRLSIALRLLQLVGHLPLPVLHLAGSGLGLLAYLLAPRYRRRQRANLRMTQLATTSRDYSRLCWRNARESGKAVTELLAAWVRSPAVVAGWVREVVGWQHVETAQQAGRGIIFVTPHLGCYDIAGRYISTRMPLAALYRPPKLRWLEPLMNAGRARSDTDMAATDTAGVRTLLKALKTGRAIFVLPDQVPGQGDGEWAPFFGQPAYTMTLLPRLASSTGATVVMLYGERLPWGRGYRLHFSLLPQPFTGARQQDAHVLNQAVEALVRQCPEQYLWSYNRYKNPTGQPIPATSDNDSAAR